jgi:hypothetical protein
LLTRCTIPYRLLGSDSSLRNLQSPAAATVTSRKFLAGTNGQRATGVSRTSTRLPESDDRKFFHEAPRVSHRHELWLLPCEPPNGGAGRDWPIKEGFGSTSKFIPRRCPKHTYSVPTQALEPIGWRGGVAGDDQCGTLYR